MTISSPASEPGEHSRYATVLTAEVVPRVKMISARAPGVDESANLLPCALIAVRRPVNRGCEHRGARWS